MSKTNMQKFIAGSVTAAVVASAVAPAASAAEVKSFKDVSADHWAYDAITSLVNAGVINGYPDNTFRPGLTLNRGQAANLLTKALDLPIPTDLKAFSDVSEKSAFAEGAAATKAAGIFGGSNGKFGAADQLTREQMATVIVRAFDLKDTGKEVTFTDEAKISASHRENVKILAQNGITTGKADGSFDPKGTVSRAHFATFLQRAVEGQTPVVKEIASIAAVADITAKEGEKVELPKTVEVTYKDDSKEAVAVTWKETDFSKPGVYNVEGTVEGTELKAAVKVTVQAVAPEVKSVSASNLKEIVVSFNKELDKESAEDLANYTLSTGTVSAAKLSDDKKTVVLTLTSSVAQQTKLDVTIKNVKSADNQTVADTKKSVTFFDTTAPVAEKVEVVGPKTLKVTFNEPLNTVPTFKLNGGAYSVTVNGFNAGDKVVTLTLGAVLPTGSHDLEISGGQDYANFAVVKANSSFEYATDTTAPTVTVDKASETKVTLKFNKPVKATGLNTDVTVYHTVNNAAGYKGTLTAVNADANGYTDTYEATFTTPIPSGQDKNIFLNTKENKFEDLWGNDVATTTLSFGIVADTSAPVVLSAEATGKDATAQKEITLTFDEEVVKADAENKANYVLKDAQGNVVKTADFADVDNNGKFGAGATLSYNNTKKQLKISFTNALKAGEYKLEVSNIKDTSFASNKMATQTVNVSVADKIAPTVGNITHDAANGVIYVNFSEAMNGTDLANPANYGLAIGGASKGLPTGSTVEVVSPQKVKITIPSGAAYPVATNTVHVQVVGTVKDLAGNAIGGLFGTSTDSITWGSASAFTITPAANQLKLVAKNQFKFDLNTELSAIDSSKFTLTNADGAAVASATYVNNAGKSTVTVTLDKDLTTTDLAQITSLAIANGGLTNAEGLALSGGPVTFVKTGTSNIEDKVAPEITKVETTAVNKVTLTFSENLKAGDVSNLTFSVAGNTVSAVDNTTANKVVITLADNIDTDATPAVTQNLDVRDANNNVLAAGTAVKATVDASAPTKAVSADANWTTAGQVTIKFSEAVKGFAKADIAAVTSGSFAIGTDATVTAVNADANGYATTWVINFGTAGAGYVAEGTGDTITVDATKVVDIAGNAAGTSGQVITFTAK